VGYKLMKYEISIPSQGEVGFHQQYDYDFYLEYEDRVVIHGIVRDPNGDPLNGAVVKFFKPGPTYDTDPCDIIAIGHVITDECGQFIFGPLTDNVTLIMKVFYALFDQVSGTATPMPTTEPPFAIDP